MKKVGILTTVAKKIELCSIFFVQASVAFSLILTKFSSLSNESNFRALALLLIELWPFSPHNLWKSYLFFYFFIKVTPQEESKCKNAQFLRWILKDDDVYFKKITAS